MTPGAIRERLAELRRASAELRRRPAAETLDGKILAMIRPIFSPTIWEAWSHDGGRTWRPISRGQFPMYASCGAMIVVSTVGGNKLAEYALEAPPVLDGIAAAHGRLYLATVDGKVLCFSGVR